MLLFVRTDASLKIGGGHVMRCLALASELRPRQATVRFICRELPGNLIDRIRHAGFAVDRLPPPPACPAADPPRNAHGHWLEVDESVDAAETAAILAAQPHRADWLIVDHYALERVWEERVLPHVEKLGVIDDLADRPHACELLLDQSLSPAPAGRYRELVPSGAQMLLGPRFALLRREFAERRELVKPRSGRVRRLLISFGAVDADNQTAKALEALRQLPGGNELSVDVVVGPTNPHLAAIRAEMSTFSNCRLHAPAENMAELMAAADLALGASGATSWERCSVGLPAIVVQVGDNQRLMGEELHRAGAIHFLGEQNDVTPQRMTAALQEFMSVPEKISGMSRRALEVTDGFGAVRTSALLGPLHLRRAQNSDCRLLWEWATDPEVRQNSFHPEPIPWETHQRWFAEKMISPQSFIWIGWLGDVPVGQIRFDVEGDRAIAGLSVAREQRKHGYGLELLLKALALFQQIHSEIVVQADVKANSASSQRLFRLAGFRETPPPRAGVLRFRNL